MNYHRQWIVTREVTRTECPWLERDLQPGDRLYPWTKYDYGICTPFGIPVSEVEGEYPIFEVPTDAVTPD